ncbi:MAG: hypothetical protein ACREBD_12320 [Blastocatellia bacterium]
MILETERLILREITQDDFDSMIRPENIPSRRVAERNGLKIERELFWRGFQHFVYAIEIE